MNSSAGNDNYKPGLEPPDPVHPSYRGWLSGNMAQLMVFLNGLILTLTAFATLSIFIDELIKENLSRAGREVQEHIVSVYRDAEQNLQALSVITSGLNLSKEKQLSSFVNTDNFQKNYFKQIYWLYEDPSQDRFSNWGLSVLKEDKQENILSFESDKDKKNFIDFIVLQSAGRSSDEFIIPNLPQIEMQDGYEFPLIHDRVFALVSKVRGGGYIVGITSINYFIDLAWFEQRPFVKEVDVVDVQGDISLYTIQMNKINIPTQQIYSISEQLSGRAVEIRAGLSVGGREAFLQKIPFLMLLFGVTLTLIGTLYVRNNQSQSRKLANMNKELAHKNFELNQEMSERERLNKVIQKSAEENRSIINSVSDIIFETTIDGTLVFLNETWKKVTGFELERSIGRNLFDLIYVQDQEEQKYHFEEFIKGHKQSYRAFTRLRSSDGFSAR